MSMVAGTEELALDEGRRLLRASAEKRVDVRLIGGVAVALRCPSAAFEPLARTYKDIDLVTYSRACHAVQGVLEDAGYSPERRFNAINGHRRLLYKDEERVRQIDVIIDQFSMCHAFEFKDRLTVDEQTLPLADLVLTKMQIFEINHKDLQDAAALFADHEITPGSDSGIDAIRIARLTAADWGWWRTFQLNRERLRTYISDLGATWTAAQRTLDRLEELFDHIERAPKSMRWKMRSKMGDRVPWYELPEEVR